jgi:hypothetical protein
MYGQSDTPEFLSPEGGEDHGVEVLFCWDGEGRLGGAVVNVACPSQVVEGHSFISADFWSAVRRLLRERHGGHVQVLALCGAAGDQSPRDLVRRGRTEPDMRGGAGLEEMGRRIADAVDRALEDADRESEACSSLRHLAEELVLPARIVTEQEAEGARRRAEELEASRPEPGSGQAGRLRHVRRLLDRHESQGPRPEFRMQLHALRLGEVGLVTNPFELFLDYGLRIKARSQARQTLVAQLSCGRGGYLPTAKAVSGEGYGGRVDDGEVGPEGGRVLVERSVEMLNGLGEAGSG